MSFDLAGLKSINIDVEDRQTLKFADETGKHYYDPNDFVPAYWQYIKNRIESNELECVPENHLQSFDCFNLFYIDIDCHVTKSYNLSLLCYDLAELFTNAFCKANTVTYTHKFVFTPTEFPEDAEGTKIGAHVMLFSDKSYPKEGRKEMHDKAIALIKANNDLKDICDEIVPNEKVFDINPLKCCMTLMPFAIKIGAKRNYKLVNAKEIDLNTPFQMLPLRHVNLEDLEDTGYEINDQMVYMNHSCVLSGMVQFIRSLRYLCCTHPFWEILSDHGRRMSEFVRPIFNWCVLQTHMEYPEGIEPTGKSLFCVAHLLAEDILDLIIMTNASDKIENDYQSLYSYMKSGCIKAYVERGSCRILLTRETFVDLKYAQNKSETQLHNALKHKYPKNPLAIEEASRRITQLRFLASDIYSKMMDVMELFAMHLTEEIRPFERVIERSMIRAVDTSKATAARYRANTRGDITFDKYNETKRQKNGPMKTYIETIKTWSRVYLCFSLYQKRSQFLAIRNVLMMFVSHFTRNVMDGVKMIPIFYNIRQTESSKMYSYNQWIVDEKNELTRGWLSSIYYDFVDAELSSSNQRHFVTPFLKGLRKLYFGTSGGKSLDLLPFEKMHESIESITKDIQECVTATSTYRSAPRKLDVLNDSPYFPMRNCIIEFVTDNTPKTHANHANGDIIVHRCNFDKYMLATTNVFWQDGYSKKNAIYQKVKRIFKEIYPDYELMTYVRTVFALTLHSIGGRDQIYQFYGTGAEGKSMINNAVAAMLGREKELVTVQKTYGYDYEEGMADPNMLVVGGLAGNMRSSALTGDRPGAFKNSHDSGGIIQMAGKRFCSIPEQEGNDNGCFNVGIAKQLTGDNDIMGRQVFKEAIGFTPKGLITMQTNTLFGYSEDTDAVARRFAVIPHDTKFITNTFDRSNMHCTVHDADTTLNGSFKNDPAYWQALFYFLLPCAKDFIVKGIRGLSDIPKTKRMMELFDASRKKSSGLVGWIANNLVPCPWAAHSLKEISHTILEKNKEMVNAKNGAIDESWDGRVSQAKRESSIYRVLANKFGGRSIFKLRKEFWNGVKITERKVSITDKYGKTKMLQASTFTKNEEADRVFDDDYLELWFGAPPKEEKKKKKGAENEIEEKVEANEEKKDEQKKLVVISPTSLEEIDNPAGYFLVGYEWLNLLPDTPEENGN